MTALREVWAACGELETQIAFLLLLPILVALTGLTSGRARTQVLSPRERTAREQRSEGEKSDSRPRAAARAEDA